LSSQVSKGRGSAKIAILGVNMRHLKAVLLVSAAFLIPLPSQAQVQRTFNTVPQYSGTFPVAIADFNQHLDIANTVSMLLGNGDGTFRTGTPLPGSASYMFTADFNGDGKPDVAGLATGGLTPPPIQVFIGKRRRIFSKRSQHHPRFFVLVS